MGVLRAKDRTGDLHWLVQNNDSCFLCGEKFSEKELCIYWQGESMIVLHKSCAAELACHLISDFTRANTPNV